MSTPSNQSPKPRSAFRIRRNYVLDRGITARCVRAAPGGVVETLAVTTEVCGTLGCAL
jgi:hypothetical protein